MSSSIQKNWFLALTLLVTAVALASTASAAQIVTNWVAYNDHFPNYTTPVNGWVTHPRATGYDMGDDRSPTGNLTNFLNGQQLPVVLTSMHTGTRHDFGLAVAPSTNSPAAQIFRGIVDISNEGTAQPA